MRRQEGFPQKTRYIGAVVLSSGSARPGLYVSTVIGPAWEAMYAAWTTGGIGGVPSQRLPDRFGCMTAHGINYLQGIGHAVPGPIAVELGMTEAGADPIAYLAVFRYNIN